jgi:hypothetical protein
MEPGSINTSILYCRIHLFASGSNEVKGFSSFSHVTSCAWKFSFNSVTLTTFVLLQRLTPRFPTTCGSSSHRLFISAFIYIASKASCNNTCMNKSRSCWNNGCKLRISFALFRMDLENKRSSFLLSA